jgi:3-dehydroquinate dehydratase/shikimate dehydrogenase
VCGAEPLLREQLDSRYFRRVHPRHAAGCFFDGRIPANLVFDMVYNPLDPALIQHAVEQKKTVVRGIEMFLEQAVRQFEIWTGESAPKSAMEKAALEALGPKNEQGVPEF